MATVLVFGPNLHRGPRDAGETFHVHAPGCADLRRPIYRGASEPPWQLDNITRELDIVADVYPPDNFDYDLDDPDERVAHETDIRIFPCVKGLA